MHVVQGKATLQAIKTRAGHEPGWQSGRNAMVTKTRGIVAAAMMSAVFAGGLPHAASAQHVLKLAFAGNEGSPYDTFAKEFSKEIERLTNGAVKGRVFCCFKMGSEEETFKKLQLGTLDGTLIAQNNAGPFYPKIDLMVLPYIFQSYEHAVKVLDGPIGKKIWSDMPAKADVHLIKVFSIAFRHIYNTKTDIKSIDDFKRLKYRVPKNVVMIDTYKAFGNDPIPLAWGETLTATQTGTVDGGDLPVDIIYYQKFHEVAKHVALTGHFALAPPFFVGDKFMQKLTPEQRAAIYQAADIAAAISRKQTIDDEEGLIKILKEKHGVKFTEPDKAPFIAAAAKVQEAFAKERGPDYLELVKEIQAAAK
jgi:tripartite ATP-independent transporter DctP family solute receptor